MTLFGWAGLAGTTFAAALLQAVSGFGFAVLAVPLYLLLVDPARLFNSPLFSRQRSHSPWFRGCGEPSLRHCCCA